MTPEQEAAREMREKARRHIDLMICLAKYPPGAVRMALVDARDEVNTLPLPEPQPDPRDAALAKASVALKILAGDRAVTNNPDADLARAWKEHVDLMRRLAAFALAEIESALKGGMP